MSSTRRLFLLQSAAGAVLAQTSIPLLRRVWTARWIAVPDTHPTEFGVYHFRRTLELAAKPERFVVHVSGDHRYRLFVNGIEVCWGPARGDLSHWRYETLDLAPHLQTGRNLLAAELWNAGDTAPMAQISLRTAFVLQGDSAAERAADTGPTWRCLRNEAYSARPFTSSELRGYYAAGPGEKVDAARYPWNWQRLDFDDSTWRAAAPIVAAAGRETSDSPSAWMLVERTIPAMEETPAPLPLLRRTGGDAQGAAFQTPITAPANTTTTLLLDQRYLMAAYPQLTVSGGKGARVRMAYAEALYEPAVPGHRANKGNRSAVDGKEFVGTYDELLADGGSHRTLRPLWWRTYRYLQLTIECGAEPLTIDAFGAVAVGYPFQRRARFDGASPELALILDTGWRTARLCAHETYMDCPYYEQLQYVGDTRIQCLISLYNSGDARLMRNAIELIGDSRDASGATMSRYPTRLQQFIPGFSIWWIAMVHDYWRYVDEPEFVHRMLPGVRSVLAFFEALQKPNGSLGPLPWWRYFDWVPAWDGGGPPTEPDGSSAPFDLLLLLGYRWAAEMEEALGLPDLARVYRQRERQMRDTAQSLYWDAARRLYADTPRKQQFSQHTNTMAVLTELIEGDAARDLMRRVETAADLAPTSLFFRFYMHGALIKAGEGARYLDWLDDWRKMLALGLTTFAEEMDRPDAPSRSDCHAWSASPNIEIFRTVLGVDSAAPGFRRALIRPNPGKLPHLAGSVPHPKGEIGVSMDPRAGGGWNVEVSLPAGIPGDFEWNGKRIPLTPGVNRFSV